MKRIKRDTATDRNDRAGGVYEQLRALIVSGRLGPGARLVEREVASRLGASRTPVRSALQRLQQERYVVGANGGKHTRLSVAPLTMEDADELFELVGLLEGAAARRATLLPAPRRARLTTELSEINVALSVSAARIKPDQREIFDLDAAFHRAYVDAGAGSRIGALHTSVKPQAERYIRLYVSLLADAIDSSVAEHEIIIGSIRSGDATAAESSVRDNWRNASQRLAEVIGTVGEKGTW